ARSRKAGPLLQRLTTSSSSVRSEISSSKPSWRRRPSSRSRRSRRSPPLRMQTASQRKRSPRSRHTRGTMDRARSYSGLAMIDKYLDRLGYLSLGDGDVREETYGWERYLNQSFYRSSRWKAVRDAVIIRDNGMDMGLDGHPIFGKIIVHHINPIAPWHIKHQDPSLYDMDNLVCV